MFTGIIEAVGNISAITSKGSDFEVSVNCDTLDLADVKIGDSIATNGICLTVVKLTDNSYVADLSIETLSRTAFNYYKVGQAVNLEKAMLPTTRFGGHIVSGHVDAVAEVIECRTSGRAIDIWVRVPSQIEKYLSEKGSVTVDGVSLTVNAVRGNEFKLTIVPHTVVETTIADFKVGNKINIEVDILARYIERLLLVDKPEDKQSKISMDLLERNGFLL
ncbi:riboflavin synthase subunit alpha [Photobacterium kishitanii]|uniref:Riboflavin synthase n=1 Tax=Photobacterium kishitanii TaxID=318456 RepID=A7MAU0_9GAMM|nr:riboflavin synthase [Photobacterium kishitanii]ABU50705.1 RibE [Photobacterium kishitanii]ABU50712.1 RibE [Photobacterium kishitanii]KJG58265.1 riboflavin synthase subunit alpha [Photobacterium kishitanii]KJG61890.1 riboflavin synthase subunit alpha [Photobacterium kishitanii]KJG66067.1 riboflavin synthase subunit alpha [Photobacterium kishitanii]